MGLKRSGSGRLLVPCPLHSFAKRNPFRPRFCTTILERDPHACFETVSVPILYRFFEWILSQKFGKDGRRLRGIKTSSSLGTCWKIFRLVYERATGVKLDPKLNRLMHKVRYPS